MNNAPDVTAWGKFLISRRIDELRKIQRKARKRWSGGKHVHKLRTHARRLRAAAEDLRSCISNAQQLIDESKDLGHKTGQVRDADVLIRRLRGYRRFAGPAERAEIDTVCEPLFKQRKAARKPAKDAIDEIGFRKPK